jgi:hypothetical protein
MKQIGAKAALAFAHEEARLRDATLRAVHAWQFGYIGYTGFAHHAACPIVIVRSKPNGH